MTKVNKERRQTLAITLAAAGIFFLGAALIPLLAGAQQEALSDSAVLSIPSAASYPAPQLSLTDLQGDPASLDDYAGQVILVNNWATWCPPCQAEMPELEEYYQEHAADGFVVIGIESGEPADVVQKFVQQYKITFPVWLDPDIEALDAFHNWELPSSYIIDRTGTVRLYWTGQIDRATLEKYVTPLLEE